MAHRQRIKQIPHFVQQIWSATQVYGKFTGRCLAQESTMLKSFSVEPWNSSRS